jgi:hypothetical protein
MACGRTFLRRGLLRGIMSGAEPGGTLPDPPGRAALAPSCGASLAPVPPPRRWLNLQTCLRVLGPKVRWPVVVIAIGGVALYGAASWVAHRGQAFVDAAVPRIVQEWDSRELSHRASPDLLLDHPMEQIELAFEHFAADLGPLRAYRGSKNSARPTFAWSHGLTVTASYTAMVICEKAHITIQIRVVWRGEHWRIDTFEVEQAPIIHHEA